VSLAVLGLALLLAVHLVVSTSLSLLVALAVRWVEGRPLGSPARRASVLLFLGLLPALGGLAVALGLAFPAWLVHEPRGTSEAAGPVLVALAAAGAALVLGRAGGALRDQWRTSCLVRRWSAAGRPLAGLPLPATRFAHEFPVAAIVGVVWDRLFLAERLVRALSPEELDGVVAHEAAHRAARDNLKRLLLRASPDLFAFTRAGVRLHQAFEDAAEAEADARACARVSPLVLARALLKVASLVPPGQRLDAAVAAFHRDGSLSARVRALVAAHEGADANEAQPARCGGSVRRGLGTVFAVATLAVLVAAGALALRPVHGLLEALVHLLS
jgi:Zn-dependent protease with chaperone function